VYVFITFTTTRWKQKIKMRRSNMGKFLIILLNYKISFYHVKLILEIVVIWRFGSDLSI